MSVRTLNSNSVADRKLRVLSPWPTICVNGSEKHIGSDGMLTLDTRPGQEFLITEKRQ